METETNLAELTKDISHKLMNAKYLTDILADIADGDGKLNVIIKQLAENINSAFEETEECRHKIYIKE